MKNKLYLLNLSMIALLIIGILAGCTTARVSRGTVTIAVAESNPGSEEKPNPHSLYAGVRMAAEQLNDKGGVNGYTIQIVPYSDNNDPELASLNAGRIIKSDAIAVIGHSTSRASQAAAPIYQQVNLPAINAAPVTQDTFKNFQNYYNISYTSEQQGAYLAYYAKNNLDNDRAMVIYMNETSAEALAKKFEHTYRGMGGQILFSKSIQANASDQEIETVVGMAFGSESGVLLILASDEVSAKLVIALKNRGFQNPIIGGDNLSTRGFIDRINSESAEQAQPGYLTDGIITTRALLLDSARGFTEQFVTDYEKKYPNIQVSNSAARGYDAALIISRAVQMAQNNQAVVPDRQTVNQALSQLNEPKTALDGVTGPIYFDSNRNATPRILLGTYQDGILISAPVQFEPIRIPENIPDLQDKVSQNHIITLDGCYMYVTHVIYTGIDLISIKELDQKSSTYTADFYLWFRFIPQQDDKVFQPENIVFTNAEAINSKDVIKEETTDAGYVYKTLRVSGKFKNQFNFRAYPFDQQDLGIQFRNQGATATFIQYVIDRPGMRYLNDTALLKQLLKQGTFDPLYGWVPLLVRASQELSSTTSTLGDPQNFKNAVSTDFSQFTLHLRIKRDSLVFIIKSLLPLLITLILAYISFYLPLGHSERLGIGSTALLTTAFFHFSLASSLPEIGYTVAIEYFFYAAYFMSALIVFLETLSIRMESKAEQAQDETLKDQYRKTRQKLNVVGRNVYISILMIVLGLGGFAYKGIINFNLNTEADHLLLQSFAKSQVTSLDFLEEKPVVSADKATTLQLASWRPEDDAQIRSLLQAFHEKNPDINIVHLPISGAKYGDILSIRLNSGSGPDMFFVPPFERKYSRFVIDHSMFKIDENIPESLRIPWQDDNGKYFGVPYVGVVEGVYYNKDIFDKLQLSVPVTWEEFLTTAETIKKAGYIPIANSLVRDEDNDFFTNLGVNAIGGLQGRNQYMVNNGRCFNDPHAVQAFKFVADIVPYLSNDFSRISSYTSKQRFVDQQAAMLFGGSWDVHYFSDNAKFNWGVFAPPALRGSQTYVIFQPDIAIGINKSISKQNQEAAIRFLQWLNSDEALNLTVKILPGFYPLNKTNIPPAENVHSAQFQRLAKSYPTDIRWAFSELITTAQVPTAATLMERAQFDMATKGVTPREAADQLQAGMAQWYEPAQTCKP